MTVDEALAIVETVLDYDRLNKVQELVFRQSWEGRSYIEIAKNADYEPDYIKDAGAKLWKLLSKAFGEKVKKDNVKSVLKRYLGRHQIILSRTQVIQVNLKGASITGRNISEGSLLGHLNKARFCHSDSPTIIRDDEHIDSNEEIKDSEVINEQITQFQREDIILWKGLRFRSAAQVKIAEALDRTGILFIPNSQMRLTTPDGRQNQEANFLIFNQGKLGILEIDSETSPQDNSSDEIRTISFKASGIHLVKGYDANKCSEEPDLVVQEFLDILSQA